MRKIWAAIAAVAAAVMIAAPRIRAAVTYQGTLANEAGLTFNNTYALDTANTNAGSFTAQVAYTSTTFSAASFTDGTQSTGSLTVSSNSGLVAASATGSFTVSSTSSLLGCALTVTSPPGLLPSAVLRQGVDWSIGATTGATATSIAAALSNLPAFASATPSSNVVNLTAKSKGAFYNSVTLASSCGHIVASGMSGGLNNAVLMIAGTRLIGGIDWTVGGTTTLTAGSIVSAINGNARLSNLLATVTNTGAVVNLKSKTVGATTTFPLVSSTANIAVSGANMTGGTNGAWKQNTTSITIPNHGFTTALQVLYSTGTSPAIGGLTSGTTYYAIINDTNHIALASSQAHALAGTAIVLTTVSNQTTADTYTLTPLAIAGTPSFKYQESNDGVNYTDIANTTTTISSYSNPAAIALNSFPAFGFRFLRLNVTAPTAGGLFLKATIVGTQP